MPNFAGDPIYQQSRLTANRDLQDVLRNALQHQSQLFLQLGNPALAHSVYGANTSFWNKRKGKEVTLLPGQKPKEWFKAMTPYEQNQLAAIQAGADPDTGTSTFAKIGREYQLAQRDVNEQMNAANMFYSGARNRELGELARNRQFAESDALFQTRQGLQGITDQILAARRQRRMFLQSAAEQAYQRMLAMQLAGG